MPRKLEAYVEEILSSISEIELFTQNLNFNQYVQDSKTKAAVERKLLTIGEALNQANSAEPSIERRVTDFRKIVGFRNILAHVYFGVDDALVWDVVQSKLKQLKADLKSLNK